MKPNLTRLRKAQESILDLTATVYRVTLTPDDVGNLLETRTTVGTYGVTLGAPANEGEREIAKRVTAAASWYMTLPHGVDIRALDQVEVSGRLYQVIHSLDVLSFDTALRVLVAEVRL